MKNNSFKSIIAFILGLIIAAFVAIGKDVNGLDEILKYFENWYNNNVALANTAGLGSFLVGLYAVYSALKSKEDKQKIEIDVNQSSAEVAKVGNRVEEQNERIIQLENKIAGLTDILFIFANSTKISDTTKTELAKVYGKVANNETVKEVQKVVEVVKEKVPEIKQEVMEVVESVQENIIEPVIDLKSKIKEQLRSNN